MARLIANVDVTTETFASWVVKTNQLLDALSNEILTANQSFANTGNTAVNRYARLFGGFTANSVYVFDTLSGGANSTIGGTLTIGSNATINGTLLNINANVVQNATSFSVQSNNVLIKSNTSVTAISVQGNSTATNTTIGGTTLNITPSVSITGLLTTTANANFDSGLLFLDAVNNRVGVGTISPDATFVLNGTANVSGATRLANSLAVVGAATLSNTIAVTGNATFSNQVTVAGNLNVTGTITGATFGTPSFANAVTFSNTIAVTGNATFSNQVTIVGNTRFSNTIAVTGNATFSNSVTIAGSLIVSGSVIGGASGATLTANSTDTQTFYLPLSNATSGTWTNAVVSSTKLYFVPSTGVLSATGFTSLSDLNRKTNLKLINNPTNTIRMINGYEFDWSDGSGKSAGVIAQYIEQLLPHLVNTASDGGKSVNYSGLIAYLIETIKELDARITTLENK